MDDSRYWQARAQEKATMQATRLKELQEQHGQVPSLHTAYASTRKPVEPKQERSTENYALSLGLAPGDPLAKEALANHFEQK